MVMSFLLIEMLKCQESIWGIGNKSFNEVIEQEKVRRGRGILRLRISKPRGCRSDSGLL